MKLADARRDYHRARLRRGDLQADPFEQFRLWLEEAHHAGVVEPTAMSLATASAEGRPRARTVLLKGLDARGFVFFTNFESRKGRELAGNPRACLLFPWLALERQVAVTGRVEKLPADEALAYFASRPRESQLAAWASRQSGVIDSREQLEEEYERVAAKFAGGEVPLPPDWGGYRVMPDTIEFWQGRPNRLHDRFEYIKRETGSWAIQRLAP